MSYPYKRPILQQVPIMEAGGGGGGVGTIFFNNDLKYTFTKELDIISGSFLQAV